MPELQEVGEAVTGGAMARAVELGAGEAANGHARESKCLNCGTSLTGPYCHKCGQRSHVHRTIAAWWHDFLHSVLHLDGKFWRTLPMLAWKPGELTRRYAHGERAKFISPLALFLFTVFLMFAAMSAFGPAFVAGDSNAREGIGEAIAESRQELARLQDRRSRMAAEGQSTAAVDAQITDARQEIAMFEQIRERGVAAGVFTRVADEQANGDSWFDAALRKAQENPELLFYKMQANAYKFSWALIPISVPFVWILFLHRSRYRRELTLYDHLVFVTYSIAFMSFALVAFVLLAKLGLGGGIVGTAFMLIPPLHIYRQLRGAYQLSRWSAAWRTFVLLVFASIALSLFAMVLLLLGALA